MNDDEKDTLVATLAAHEEVITILLSRVLRDLPQEELNALDARMKAGVALRPDAPKIDDLDMADRIAGQGQQYDEVMQRMYAQSLQLAGRSAG